MEKNWGDTPSATLKIDVHRDIIFFLSFNSTEPKLLVSQF